MKRLLCYKHHCQEFDKLPNALRHMAADWRTAAEPEKCELYARRHGRGVTPLSEPASPTVAAAGAERSER